MHDLGTASADTSVRPPSVAPPATATHPGRARRLLPLLVLVGVLLLTLAWLELFRGRFVDDAYIAMRYADQLAGGGSWGLIQDRPSNTATSPLGVLVLALAGLVLPDLVTGVLVATAMQLVVLGWALVRLCRRLGLGTWPAVAGYLALAVNPLLLSTLGLETVMYAALIAVALAEYADERWDALAVALGLLALTRPDGAVLLVVLLAVLGGGLRRRLRVLAVFLAVQLPWLGYSTLVLGSPVPDTLLIKTGPGPWGGSAFSSGPGLYLDAYPLATVASLALVVLVPLCLLWSGRRAGRVVGVLAAYGLLHYGAYSLLAVPPYHWYYASQVVTVALLGALGLGFLRRALPGPRATAAVAAACLLPLAGTGLLMARDGLPAAEPFVHSNWATPDRYREIGLWLAANVEPDAVVALEGELGTLAYYSELALVNEFTDLNVATRELRAGGALERPLVGPALQLATINRRLLPSLPPADYLLRHVPYDDDGAEVGGQDVVMRWDTSSRWVPEGRLYLVALPER